MDPLTIINLSAALIKAGFVTYAQIKQTLQANQGTLTDERVNAILDALIADDEIRAKAAEDDAKNLPPTT
jgi:hypothetical protein